MKNIFNKFRSTLKNCIPNVKFYEDKQELLNKILVYYVLITIAVAIGIIIVQSFDVFAAENYLFIERCILGVFVVEFLIRIINKIWFKKIREIFTFLMLVDLLVLIVFGGMKLDIVFLRVFRVISLLEKLKLLSYSRLMKMFFHSFRYYAAELKLLWVSFILVFLSSGLGLYVVEHDVNETFASLGNSLWWAIVTITTVGYGDAVPITVAGKMVAGIVIVLGLAMIALLTAILTKVFLDHFFGKRLHHCEFCHYPHHDFDAMYCKNCGNKLDVSQLQKADSLHPHFLNHD